MLGEQQQQQQIRNNNNNNTNDNANSPLECPDTTTDRNFTILPSWSPLTTRLLLNGRNGSSWDVMDNVIHDIPNFVTKLKYELYKEGIFHKLKPSKTNGEKQQQDIVSILSLVGLSQQQQQQQQQDPFHIESDNIRGDQSCFIGRDLLRTRRRRRNLLHQSNIKNTSDNSHTSDSKKNSDNNDNTNEFESKFPYLSLLINRIEDTAEQNLSSSSSSLECKEERDEYIDFDKDMTSVQLAVFPGDGKSKYIRHCDREKNICRYEKEEHPQNKTKTKTSQITIDKSGIQEKQGSSSSSSSSNSERIITAVYYLTPNDWDVQKDGGCLRIYTNDSNNSTGNNESYNDIAPYSNRSIIFRSDCVEHEVLPNYNKKRPRIALTIWLYGKKVGTKKTKKKESRRQSNTNNDNDVITSDDNNSSSNEDECVNHNKLLQQIQQQIQQEQQKQQKYAKHDTAKAMDENKAYSFYENKNINFNDSINNSLDNNKGIGRPGVPFSTTFTAANPTDVIDGGRNPPHSRVNNGGPPPLPVSNNSDANNNDDVRSLSIFVNIASYRDSEIIPTIYSLLKTALHAQRIYIGLVLQIDTRAAAVVKTKTTNSTSSLNTNSYNDDLDAQSIINQLVLLFNNNDNPTLSNANDEKANNVSNNNDSSTMINDSWLMNHIRCITLDIKDSTGPCYARSLGQSLYKNENYILQIDSHMRFRYNWDAYIINEIESLINKRRDEKMVKIQKTKRTEEEVANKTNANAAASASASTSTAAAAAAASEKDIYNNDKEDDNNGNNYERVMLTTYPVGYTLPNDIPNIIYSTILRPYKFDNDGDCLLRQKGHLLNNIPKYPIPCYLYAGGFNFVRVHKRNLNIDIDYKKANTIVIQKYPFAYDGTNNTHHLFFGEELSMAVRLYTHGYDLFSPTQSICYHLYNRSYRPTIFSDSNNNIDNLKRLLIQQQKKKAINFVKQQLVAVYGKNERNSNDDNSYFDGLYCLGKVRTTKEFAEAIGVNFQIGLVLENNKGKEMSILESLISLSTSPLTSKFNKDYNMIDSTIVIPDDSYKNNNRIDNEDYNRNLKGNGYAGENRAEATSNIVDHPHEKEGTLQQKIIDSSAQNHLQVHQQKESLLPLEPSILQVISSFMGQVQVEQEHNIDT